MALTRKKMQQKKKTQQKTGGENFYAFSGIDRGNNGTFRTWREKKRFSIFSWKRVNFLKVSSEIKRNKLVKDVKALDKALRWKSEDFA